MLRSSINEQILYRSRFPMRFSFLTVLMGQVIHSAVNHDSACETNGSIRVCKVNDGAVDIFGATERRIGDIPEPGCTMNLPSVAIADMDNIRRAIRWFPHYIFKGCITINHASSKQFNGETVLSMDKKSVTCRINNKDIASFTSTEKLKPTPNQSCESLQEQRSMIHQVSQGTLMMLPMTFHPRTQDFEVAIDHPDVVRVAPQEYCSVTVRIPKTSSPEWVFAAYKNMFKGGACLGGGSQFVSNYDADRAALPVTKIFLGARRAQPGRRSDEAASVVVCWSGDQLIGRYELRFDWEAKEKEHKQYDRDFPSMDRAGWFRRIAMRWTDGEKVSEFLGDGGLTSQIDKYQSIGICREISAIHDQLARATDASRSLKRKLNYA